jgi:hypothetical protein
MLASLEDAPLQDPNLVYEPKYDGIRAMIEIAPKGEVRLWSRLGNEKTHQFPEVAEALAKLGVRDATVAGHSLGGTVATALSEVPDFKALPGPGAHLRGAISFSRRRPTCVTPAAPSRCARRCGPTPSRWLRWS